jgi:hypothetical protein
MSVTISSMTPMLSTITSAVTSTCWIRHSDTSCSHNEHEKYLEVEEKVVSAAKGKN